MEKVLKMRYFLCHKGNAGRKVYLIGPAKSLGPALDFYFKKGFKVVQSKVVA